MTVRLEVKHSLLVGVLALGSMGVFGCGDLTSETDLDPAGPPKILQAFVLDAVVGDFVLTYGVHPQLNFCDELHSCAAGLTCASSGANSGHCVDGSGNQPGVENAVAAGAEIRLVSKELLDGRTIEQFVCECQSAMGGCPSGADFSIDPKTCTACGDAAATPFVNEQGRCLDANDDGLADLATLQPGIANVTCGTLLNYDTDIGDGFYYPNGDQFPTSTQGFNGLGPAIVLTINGDVLPTDSDCVVSLNTVAGANKAVAKDKDGNAFVAPDRPIAFHTEPLSSVGSVPAADAMNVAVTTKMIVVQFNTLLASASLAGNVTVTEKTGGAAAPTGAITVMAGTNIAIALTADLKAATSYVVTVKTGVTDIYMKALPEEVTFEFKTK